jgi:ATPase subunit of ABC transporter with duplicated ATPase domains
MIHQWSVSNFKSIQKTVAVEFAPLTLFVGQNSAGKSTLIQSILMTAQTLQSNVVSRSVVLNGKIIRLGEFSDIRSNNSAQQEVTIGFELKRPTFEIEPMAITARTRYYYSLGHQEKMLSVCSSFSFSAGDTDEENKDLQLQPRLEKGSIGYRSFEKELNFDFEFKR